jgi:hypothetical protein
LLREPSMSPSIHTNGPDILNTKLPELLLLLLLLQ